MHICISQSLIDVKRFIAVLSCCIMHAIDVYPYVKDLPSGTRTMKTPAPRMYITPKRRLENGG